MSSSPAPRPGRWDALDEDFLAEVRRTGNVRGSAQRCGLYPLYYYRKGPEFRARIEEARRAYVERRVREGRRTIRACRSADGDSCNSALM